MSFRPDGRDQRHVVRRSGWWLWVLAVLLIGGAVACDLPLQGVGAPCPKLGEFARDATHVLKCVEGTVVGVVPADPGSTSPVEGDAPPVPPPGGGVWEAGITVELADVALARMFANWPTPASPAPVEQTSGCPISRRYALAAEGLPASQLKYRAIITSLGSSSRRGCMCVVAREWSVGMDLAAAQSLRDAMDTKEQEAIASYARLGLGEDRVPVQARTIFLRTSWRSFDEQACLRRTLGSQALPAGQSRHEWGIAIDIEDWEGGFSGTDHRLLRAHGWCRTFRSEGWHYEFRPALEARGQAGLCLA